MVSQFFRDQMTAVRDETFQSTIGILTATQASDGAGGQTTTWSQTSTVIGRVRKPLHRPGIVLIMGDRQQLVEHYQVLVPQGTPITGENRLLISGQTFVVRGVDSARTTPLEIIIDCDPLDEGA